MSLHSTHVLLWVSKHKYLNINSDVNVIVIFEAYYPTFTFFPALSTQHCHNSALSLDSFTQNSSKSHEELGVCTRVCVHVQYVSEKLSHCYNSSRFGNVHSNGIQMDRLRDRTIHRGIRDDGRATLSRRQQ